MYPVPKDASLLPWSCIAVSQNQDRAADKEVSSLLFRQPDSGSMTAGALAASSARSQPRWEWTPSHTPKRRQALQAAGVKGQVLASRNSREGKS